MAERRAPPNCYWRGGLLWGRIKVAGQEHRWSLRTRDGTVAKRRVKAERERLIGAAHFGEQRHKYEDVFVEWSEHIATQVGEKTAQRYAVSLKQLEPDLLPLFIDEIDKANVNAIVKRRLGEGVSIATIRRDLTALSSVCEFAEEQDYREGNPALAKLRKLKERRDPIMLPEHPHINRVVKRAPQMLAAMIVAALDSGCRESELVYAERRNFDHERLQLIVRGKRNKIRTVDLDQKTVDRLRKLPARLGCRWLFWQGEGEPFHHMPSTFRNLVKAELKAAQKAAQEKKLKEPDFRRFTFHHLRHRSAVDWLKSGRSLYDLQKRLGHTSIKTTEIYLDFLTPEEQRIVKGEAAQSAAQNQRFAKGKRA